MVCWASVGLMRPPLASEFLRLARGSGNHIIYLTSVVLARGLVYNGAVLQTPQVKHTDTAVLTARNEDIDAVGAESHIVDLLVVRNQLRLSCQGWNVPNCAGGIDARRDD
jgi:hypothetical protein